MYESDTGETYNAVTILQAFTEEELVDMGLWESENEILNLIYGTNFIWMYAPLVVLLPLISIFVMERTGGSRRYQIVRTGKVPFVIGKLLTAVFTGGIVFLFGFLLFILYLLLVFPILNELLGAGLVAQAAGKFFLYGAVISISGYIVSIFIQNVYLVYCIPFIINYLWDLCFGYKAAYMEEGRLKDMAYASLNMSAMNVRGISQQMTRYFIVEHVLYVIVAVVAYIYYLNKKTDCGK